MDSRTIYIGHKEPPPGTEAFIQQRFPDNRIVSSKVSENTHAHTHKDPCSYNLIFIRKRLMASIYSRLEVSVVGYLPMCFVI